jgi:hypothetical protein
VVGTFNLFGEVVLLLVHVAQLENGTLCCLSGKGENQCDEGNVKINSRYLFDLGELLARLEREGAQVVLKHAEEAHLLSSNRWSAKESDLNQKKII